MRSFEERRRAAIEAPRQRSMLRPDTRVIERPGWLQLVTPSAPRGSAYLNEIIFSDVPVEAVTTGSLDDYLETHLRGWQLAADQMEAERRTHVIALSASRPPAFFFLARRGGVPIATAGVSMRDTYGYLVGGQVLEAARGLGAYQALVAARLAFLAARGVDLAVTQARAATSAPILERLGFETLFRSKVYELARH